MIEFERALLMILSKNQEDRKSGELFISSLEPQPDFYKFLMFGLNLDNESACLSGILFRQKYVETLRFQTLTGLEKTETKKYLFSCVRKDRPLGYLKNLAVILVTIYRLEENFEDSFKFVLACEDLHLDYFTLFVIEAITTSWAEFIDCARQQLSALLWDKSENSESKCQVLACKLMCMICTQEQLSSPQVTDRILAVLKTTGTTCDLNGLLDSMLTQLENAPGFLLNYRNELVQILIEISLNPASGHLNKVPSIEALLKLETSSLHINTLQDLLVFAFKTMSELDHYSDIQAWGCSGQDVNAINNDNLSLGKDLLCALLGDPRTRSSYLQLAHAHFTNSYWVHQHTGILAFGYYCINGGEFLQEYKEVARLLSHQNPRIQWAVLCSLSCFVYKFKDLMDIGSEIWDLMAELIKSPLLILQIQAFETALCLLQGPSRFPETQSLSNFFTQVFEVLNNPQLPPTTLTSIFELIAYMSESYPSLFSPFSTHFLQGLQSIFKSHLSPFIKSSGIKCLVIIACNDSPQMAENCCQSLLQMLGTSDCIDSAIIESSPFLFGSLKERFYPFGNFLIDLILKHAKLKVNSGYDAQGTSLSANFVTEENKSLKWGISHEELNKKILACKTLLELSKLGAVFSPYAEETMRVVEELKHFKLNKKIKLYAKRTIKALSSLNRDVLVS